MGLQPEKSKKGDSINLNPQMVIVNDPRKFPDGKPYNGQKLPYALNEQFGAAVFAFAHCFGDPMPPDQNGDRKLSWGNGEDNNEKEPRMWPAYSGPMLNQIGTVELIEVPARVKQPDGTYAPDGTRTRTDIKRFICNVPGCQERHIENLVRAA